ncbi:MAG: hypothetical protein JWP37_716 [Mucilaginibacter sp.]|nr:hypothetical protein [Mucilaginibacter sp.]
MIHTYLFFIVSFLLLSNVAQAQLATKIIEKYNYSLYLPKKLG